MSRPEHFYVRLCDSATLEAWAARERRYGRGDVARPVNRKERRALEAILRKARTSKGNPDPRRFVQSRFTRLHQAMSEVFRSPAK